MGRWERLLPRACRPHRTLLDGPGHSREFIPGHLAADRIHRFRQPEQAKKDCSSGDGGMKDKRRERVTREHSEGGEKSHVFLRFLFRDAGKVGEGGKELPPSTFTETIGPGLVLPPIQGTSR